MLYFSFFRRQKDDVSKHCGSTSSKVKLLYVYRLKHSKYEVRTTHSRGKDPTLNCRETREPLSQLVARKQLEETETKTVKLFVLLTRESKAFYTVNSSQFRNVLQSSRISICEQTLFQQTLLVSLNLKVFFFVLKFHLFPVFDRFSILNSFEIIHQNFS